MKQHELDVGVMRIVRNDAWGCTDARRCERIDNNVGLIG